MFRLSKHINLTGFNSQFKIDSNLIFYSVCIRIEPFMWFAPLNEIREYLRIPQDEKRKEERS